MRKIIVIIIFISIVVLNIPKDDGSDAHWFLLYLYPFIGLTLSVLILREKKK